MFRVVVLSLCAMLAGLLASARGAESPLGYEVAYDRLRAQFADESPGRGLDRGGPSDLVAEQPMTYGLVLSAEAVRYRVRPTPEGRRRIRLAARWLIDNSRLDEGRQPGWGLPFAWDHRPAHTSYTITTAIAIEGLLDAMLELTKNPK